MDTIVKIKRIPDDYEIEEVLHIGYIRERPGGGLSGLLGQSPDHSESPRTFAASAANW